MKKSYRRAHEIQLTEKEGAILQRALIKVVQSIYARETRDIPRAFLFERLKNETSYFVALARLRQDMKFKPIERIG